MYYLLMTYYRNVLFKICTTDCEMCNKNFVTILLHSLNGTVILNKESNVKTVNYYRLINLSCISHSHRPVFQTSTWENL